MNSINYADLHKVYNQKLYNLPVAEPEPEKVDEPEVFEPVVTYVAPPERVPVLPEPVQMQTVFHDPVRELVSDVLPFAAGFLFWNYLTSGKKTYVGNQHISDMSDERVAEYRRRGLLD